MDKTIVFDPRWAGRAIPEKHWHFHRQLLARYGIVLAPGEFSEMLRDIKSGHAQLIEKRSGKRAIYSVRITRLYERVYVLSDGKDIFTAWPPLRKLNEIRRQMNRPKLFLRLRPVVNPDDVS
ncbi:hypothetical protein [Allomesorhizobium camelthorni]|uniref:Uncharacterized protein n=1 Tax=Allomesorhizobium camelthorni TaxID=475069 RepID=A0A6G4WMS2_9HYPH|nr:hypothetical protein [Mesorhizobium camelthorni]NGO55483.1 hypothetical protein [Mesorhizobium camelthorni]